MSKKKNIYYRVLLLLFFLSFVFLFGCNEGKKEMEVEKETVKVRFVEKTGYPEILHYIGQVGSDGMIKKSFKSGGKIQEILVKEGDFVEEETLLATIEEEDFALGENSSSNQYQAAKLDLEKAKASLDYLKEQQQKLTILYKEGAVTKQAVEEMDLQVEVQEKIYTQAQKVANQAYAALKHNQNTVEDTKLYGEQRGYVVSVEFEVGEIVGAGYPVVILRGEKQLIQVGMSPEELRGIQEGEKAVVSVGEESYEAEVTKIGTIPDPQTRTYLVELEVREGSASSKGFYLGAICDVNFVLSKREGIWIPLQYILNDGVDYVYIVEENIARRVNVTMEGMYENNILVTGLEEGSLLVVEGVDRLREGKSVLVLE